MQSSVCVCVHTCVYTCVSVNRGSVFFPVKAKARLLVMRGGNWKAFYRISLSLRTRKKMLFCEKLWEIFIHIHQLNWESG